MCQTFQSCIPNSQAGFLAHKQHWSVRAICSLTFKQPTLLSCVKCAKKVCAGKAFIVQKKQFSSAPNKRVIKDYARRIIICPPIQTSSTQYLFDSKSDIVTKHAFGNNY